MKTTDEIFADLALLSRSASGWCVKNPNVAAAVYDANGEFVSQGAHKKKLADDHAEVIALKEAGARASGGTLYVSLEPCNHVGTTGACTDAIRMSGIKKVVYALPDPNPIASGGAKALAESGIEVVYHKSEKLEFEQRAWLHRLAYGRPLITAKVAMTLDGYIAAADGTSKWITSEESREDVQLIRSQVGAIITSTETFLNDQPSLIPRIEGAAIPLRVVVGKRQVNAPGFTHVPTHNLEDLIGLLNSEGINHALVEAGGIFLSAALRANLIDELLIYQAPKILGAGKKWVENLGIHSISEADTWELLSTNKIGSDVKTHYRKVQN